MAGNVQKIAPVDTDDALWIALQLCDSGFPGGSFAHSVGRESALHHKLVTDASSTLDSFVALTLEQACTQLVPLVRAGYNSYLREGSSTDLEDSPFDEFMLVDSTCHISLTNQVARRASTTQGKTLYLMISTSEDHR